MRTPKYAFSFCVYRTVSLSKRSVELKRKLPTIELIDHVKNKGITFNHMTEKEAKN